MKFGLLELHAREDTLSSSRTDLANAYGAGHLGAVDRG